MILSFFLVFVIQFPMYCLNVHWTVLDHFPLVLLIGYDVISPLVSWIESLRKLYSLEAPDHNYFISFPFISHFLYETPWRNGSASDSRSEGCVFKSRRGQSFFFSKVMTIFLFAMLSFVTINAQAKWYWYFATHVHMNYRHKLQLSKSLVGGCWSLMKTAKLRKLAFWKKNPGLFF